MGLWLSSEKPCAPIDRPSSVQLLQEPPLPPTPGCCPGLPHIFASVSQGQGKREAPGKVSAVGPHRIALASWTAVAPSTRGPGAVLLPWRLDFLSANQG